MVNVNDILNIKKGVVRKVMYKSEHGILKKGKDIGLEKIIIGYYRFGIEYKNMKSTKEYMEANGITETNGLAWGEWENYPYIINNKGVKHVRMSEVKLPNLKTTTKYFINGVEYDKQYLIDNKYLSGSTSNQHTSVIAPKLDNIIKIYNVAE